MNNSELDALYAAQSSNYNDYLSAQEQMAVLNDRIEQNHGLYGRTSKLEQELVELKNRSNAALYAYAENNAILVKELDGMTEERLNQFVELNSQLAEAIRKNATPPPPPPIPPIPPVSIPPAQTYVKAGMKITCPFAAGAQVPYNVLPDKCVFLDGTPMACLMDQGSFINIPCLGMCSSVLNPAVAATAPVFTPKPCSPVILAPWVGGKPTVLIGGQPALLNTDTLMCAYGGVITIIPEPPKPVIYDVMKTVKTVKDGGLRFKDYFMESTRNYEDEFLGELKTRENELKDEIINAQNKKTAANNRILQLEKGAEAVEAEKAAQRAEEAAREAKRALDEATEAAREAKDIAAKGIKSTSVKKGTKEWYYSKAKEIEASTAELNVKNAEYNYNEAKRYAEEMRKKAEGIHGGKIEGDLGQLEQKTTELKEGVKKEKVKIEDADKEIDEATKELENKDVEKMKNEAESAKLEKMNEDISDLEGESKKLDDEIGKRKKTADGINERKETLKQIDKDIEQLKKHNEAVNQPFVQQEMERLEAERVKVEGEIEKMGGDKKLAKVNDEIKELEGEKKKVDNNLDNLKGQRDELTERGVKPKPKSLPKRILPEALTKTRTTIADRGLEKLGKMASNTKAGQALAKLGAKVVGKVAARAGGRIVIKAFGIGLKALGPALTAFFYFKDRSSYAISGDDAVRIWENKQLESSSDVIAILGDAGGGYVSDSLGGGAVAQEIGRVYNFAFRTTADYIDLSRGLAEKYVFRNDSAPFVKGRELIRNIVCNTVYENDDEFNMRVKDLGLQGDKDVEDFNLIGGAKMLGARMAEVAPISTDSWIVEFHDALLRKSKGLPI